MNPDAGDHAVTHDHLLEYVMGELDDVQVSQFEQHLARCSRCRGDVKALLPVHAELMTLHPDARLPDRRSQAKSAVLQHAFSRRLPNRPVEPGEDGPAQAVVAKPPGRQWAGGVRGRLRFRRAILIAGTVSALLVGGVFAWSEHAERPANQPPSFVRTGKTTANESGGAHGKAAHWPSGSAGLAASWDNPGALAAALHPTSAFAGARGQVRLLLAQNASRILVQVAEVPMQSHLGCYAVWEEQNGRLRSLGEFLVNSNGAGRIVVPVPPGGLRGRIVVTLEPRWGDSEPQGPAVLSGQVVSA